MPKFKFPIIFPNGKQEMFLIEAKTEEEALEIACLQMDKIAKRLNEKKKIGRN